MIGPGELVVAPAADVSGIEDKAERQRGLNLQAVLRHARILAIAGETSRLNGLRILRGLRNKGAHRPGKARERLWRETEERSEIIARRVQIADLPFAVIEPKAAAEYRLSMQKRRLVAEREARFKIPYRPER